MTQPTGLTDDPRQLQEMAQKFTHDQVSTHRVEGEEKLGELR